MKIAGFVLSVFFTTCQGFQGRRSYRWSAQLQPKLQATSTSDFEINLSPMVNNMALSKTIEIHSLTKEMERNGQEVYSLCVGEPDYQPPEEVVAATATAASRGNTKYTAITGDIILRQAIAADLLKRKGTKYTPEQIVVSNGAKQAVLQGLLSVVSPGDTVLIPAPYWPSYPDMVKMCNAQPVTVATTADTGYTLTPEALRAALEANPKTTCIILCNPSNPTGCVSSKEALEALARVLADFPKVVVLSDEIYEQLTYGEEHTSFAALPGMMGRTITINGFSASPVAVAKACGKLQSQITSCASSVGQEAATAALLTVSDSWIEEAKRDFAYDMVVAIPAVTCPKPGGAFYLLPDISAYFGRKTAAGRPVDDSHQLCLELLREEGVALVSGDAFGAPPCIRISYAASTELIEQSLTRLARFLKSLQ